MSVDEYKLFKLSADQISVIYGLMLFAFAVIVSSVSDSKSFTSYIPAIIGVPISAFGILSILMPSKQKIFMHFNVLLGVFVFKGGLSVVASLANGIFFQRISGRIFQGFLWLRVVHFTYSYVLNLSSLFAKCGVNELWI